MINTQIDKRQISSTLDSFSELPNQVLRAKRRAIGRETSRIATLIRRGIAEANAIPQKGLRARKRITTPKTDKNLGIIWVGYNDIAMVYAGNPKRLKTGGITFRSQQYPHAFEAIMPSGHRGFFQRRDKQRLKIDELKIPLNHVAEVVQSVRIESGKQLEARFASELNYELNVKNSRTFTL
jgi:hypothetical protein